MACPFLEKTRLLLEKVKKNHLDIYTQINSLEGSANKLHQSATINEIVFPVKSNPYRGWYEKDGKTYNHAKYCLPLSMANSLGYILRSPSTFRVFWDGKENSDAKIEIIENKKPTHKITTHSARGSFTIQYRFVFKTSDKHFTYIKGIPNIRTKFNVMEALIESWWFEGTFGVVCLLNQACDLVIKEGDPIAVVMLLPTENLNFSIGLKQMTEKALPTYTTWEWWQEIKHQFYNYQIKFKRFEIFRIFKKFNKKIKFPKVWPMTESYHDFDYTKGRHVFEKDKPKNRFHFLPKDLRPRTTKLETLYVDNYNKIINEKEN